MTNVLVVFSNPSDTSRLRLDKEHRKLDEIADLAAEHALHFERKHAATKSDLAQALAAREFKIVHLSGHGSEEGFLHSELFLLIDKQKRIRGMYDGTDSVAVNQLIEDIRILKTEK